MVDYVYLGIRGIVLDNEVYKQQRTSPERLKKGFILVLLIGLVVGAATMIGQLIETSASPNRQDVFDTIYTNLRAMPWYDNVARSTPGFETTFKETFDTVAPIFASIADSGGTIVLIASLVLSSIGLFNGVTVGIVSLLLTPVFFLAGWATYSLVAHSMARIVGGQGTVSQTFGCMAVATSATLLGLVQIVPFARVSGVPILLLFTCYLAIREAHTLPPWRAFWTTIVSSLVLLFVTIGLWYILLLIA